MDFWHVDPGDLLYQWNHLASAGTLQPLLVNANLSGSATNYANVVVNDHGVSSNPHFVSPYTTFDFARLTGAGFDYSNAQAFGENIARDFASPNTPEFLHAGFVIDWGSDADGIQTPAGHRTTMLDGAYTEVGIGLVNSYTPGSLTEVQHFADKTTTEDLWGYVWHENSGTPQFSLAEALAGVNVNLKNGASTVLSTSTNSFGGFSMDVHGVANGSYNLEFASGGNIQLIGVQIADNHLQQVNCVF
jgi:hypothetical protein